MKKFIRDNSQNFLTIWSVLTSIIILTYYSTNIYDHFGKSDTLWLVLVAFFIAILFLLVKSWLEKTSDLKVLYNDLLSEISNFKNATKEIYKKKNYLGLKMLSWRIENEISYALEIIDNSLRLPALKAFAYHRKIFGKVLLKLDKGDTYYTISNLDFWSKHKYGQQDFLKSNIEAATKGVFIKRIIVINKAILQNPQEHINDFTNLKSIVEKIYDAISQALPVVKHCLQIDFYLSDDIKKDDAYPVPFCFIENVTKDKWMIITPAMIDDERNQPEIRIRLITDKERDSDYINYQQMYEELKMKKLASHEIMYHEIQK
ncbi:MAG TPA: hypothetical protein VK590_16330, partial [Saprospiraceae bacterium]|nr:hypothetical protein [Saprospiraceae bacterium]